MSADPSTRNKIPTVICGDKVIELAPGMVAVVINSKDVAGAVVKGSVVITETHAGLQGSS